MIWGAELADHVWGLVIVSAAACVPGLALRGFLPRPLRGRDAFATLPILGGAYWAAMLYILPFRGGIIAGGCIALAGATLSVVGGRFLRERHVARIATGLRSTTRNRPLWISRIILTVGCIVYVTPLLTKHVPDGMDTSRYLMNARLIGAHAGLPRTLAPFMADVPFGAMNHGASTLAGVAVACGASPAGAVLATIPLTFALLILSLYVLMRLVVSRVQAAVVAVAVAWFSHQAQRTIAWGGFTGIFALAIGILAVRLLVDVLRGKGRSGFVPLGVCAGSLPLVHGCMAAGWVHMAMPIAAAVGLWASRNRRRGLAGAALAALVAGGIVAVYMLVGRPGLDGSATEWIRANEMADAYPGRGLQLLLTVPAYLRKTIGKLLAWLLPAAMAVLLVRRRRRALALICAGLATIVLVLINAKLDVLPTTLLLYPTRVREFSLIVVALALGLAWRELLPMAARHPRGPTVVAGVLLALAVSQHHRYFQRTAWQPVISEQAWRMLRWSTENLDPGGDQVANLYATAGAYLPGVSGVAATNWHAHFDQKAAARNLLETRPVTHVIVIERDAILSRMGKSQYDRDAAKLRRLAEDRSEAIVFSDGPVSIHKLKPIAGAPMRKF